MGDQSSADTASAILILAHEILFEIGVPDSEDMASRITVRLQEAVNQFLYRERERCVAICKRRAALSSRQLRDPEWLKSPLPRRACLKLRWRA